MEIFIGPLWGTTFNSKELDFPSSSNVHFYGAYQAFSTDNTSIDHYSSLQSSVNNSLIFHQSRFEHYFKVISGLEPEKNYLFKHWINPFSGIVEHFLSYQVSLKTIYDHPEKIEQELALQASFLKHKSFYNNLIINNFPEHISSFFENEIRSKNAFKSVLIIDNDCKTIRSIPIVRDIIKEHKKLTLNSLDKNQYA